MFRITEYWVFNPDAAASDIGNPIAPNNEFYQKVSRIPRKYAELWRQLSGVHAVPGQAVEHHSKPLNIVAVSARQFNPSGSPKTSVEHSGL